MITKENHLHNQGLVRNAALKIFEELKKKYDFVEYDELSKYNSYDCTYIGIEKNEIIIYCFISNREAYEFHILQKGQDKYNSTTVDSLFMNIFPQLSKESKIELEKKKPIKSLPYTFEYYYEIMSRDIAVLEKYFSDIFENGSTPTL